MSVKKIVMGSLVGAGMLASSAATAGWTGNVGAYSKYLFRGVSQGGSAAVQGGVDYGHDSGLYAGTWISNVGFAGNDGGAEMDLYAGWGGEITDGLGVDLGVLYYWYPEEDELGPGADDLSTLEFYAGLSYSVFSLTYYYSDELNFFIGDGNSDEGSYLNVGMELPITDTLAFTAGVGFYSGDEIERWLQTVVGSTDDDYVDYSIGIAKDVGDGMSFSLQLVDTDIEAAGIDDEIQPILGFSKEFGL